MRRIALVGDHNPQVIAHAAIPRALEIACAATGAKLEWAWIGTEDIADDARTLAGFSGVWVVPASPYRNTNGALAAIRRAREQGLPFLGTCGGFQHALIEFARNVAGIPAAGHAEIPGSGTDLIVTPLTCGLVEKSGDIIFLPGSRLHGIFAGRPAHEGYHCSYGVNPAYRARLEAAGLRFTGFDPAGDIRAAELPAHPFYIGTLFQPERSGLRGEQHPLVQAFVRAVAGMTA
jgi:CTP synthase (UTP-ammonia lyase)